MTAELIVRALGAQRRRALVWGIALVALTWSVLLVWPSMSGSGALGALTAGMPPDVVGALGLESLSSPEGFLSGNLYALLLPLLLAVIGIAHTSALTAGDEDAGRLELLLALPVGRVRVFLARFVSVGIVLGVLSLVVGASVWFGAAVLDMGLDASGIVAATVSLFLFALLHAALALALAGGGLRSGAVLTASAGVLVSGYLVHALLPLVDGGRNAARVSPWHWALGEDPLAGGFDAPGAALLGGGTLLFVVFGLVAVRGRSIRTA